MRHPTGCLAAALLLVLGGAQSPSADEQLLAESCGECHAASDSGLSRIEGQRKTPEGWMMTIVRMQQSHGLEISPEDRRALVQHLSDTQGLAPAEAAPFRYALEKDPNAQEAPEEPMGSMCARCHTEARAALQRRTAEEWLIHMDFHVGNYPTIEYQALGRDREWFRIAKEEVAPLLAEKYPFETQEWSEWLAAEKTSVAGDWIVLTDLPRAGEAYGRLKVSGEASPYEVSGEMKTAGGESLPVSGKMNLYTGYEWRATLDIGGETYRQILAVSEDGSGIEGRQFLRETDSLGGRLTGVRADAEARILGSVPSAVPAGAATVQVVGSNLDTLEASAGTAAANDFGATVELETEGNGEVTLGGGGEGRIVHYAALDSLVVEPAFTISRVGGGSDAGPDAVPAHFRAIGMWNGEDGEAGTDDDVRVGPVDAEWSVTNLHEHAAKMEDATYAGEIDAASGIFMPAVAGPNPDRPFTTNNAGELKVVASALGQSAEATMIVTVQRFIDPPIR